MYDPELAWYENSPVGKDTLNNVTRYESTRTFPASSCLVLFSCNGMWRISLKICWSAPDSTQWGEGWSTLNSGKKVVGGEGGEGGWSTLNSEKKVVGGEGGEGGQLTAWKGSAMTLEGSPLTVLILGDWSTVNLERIHNDFGRITSDNVDLGSINGQLGKELQWPWKDHLWQCWFWGQSMSMWKGSTMTLEGSPLTMLILGGVNQWSTWKGSAMTLAGSPLTMLILGGVDWWSTWKGSTMILEGSPMTMLILGRSIDSQLGKVGKDLQWLWKDHLWQCWSWGVDWQSTWKGSVMTLEGSPLTMLILGSIDSQLGKDLQWLWKDHLWQCWSWGVDWWSTWKGSVMTLEGITSDNVDPGINQWSTWKGSVMTLEGSPLTMLILGRLINGQLGKDPQWLWKDHLWQCWSWGVDWWSTWKGSAMTLEGSPLTMLILGSMVNLERILKHFGRITSDNVDAGGWSTVNLERIHDDFGRITSDSVDPGEGLINGQLWKDPWWLWKDHLWQCWSLGGQSMVNLERICNDFGRITSDNVDPGDLCAPTHHIYSMGWQLVHYISV